MANENKNIEELVSEDDDPTAELEIPNFRLNEADDADEERESDSHTHGLGGARSDAASGQSIPELQSDLESRTRTIGKLQYDIEQLRAKWLGLETEISAREEIANNLLKDLDRLKKKIARKDSLLKKRNESVKDLKAEVKRREEDYNSLLAKMDEQQAAGADAITAREQAGQELETLRTDLEAARENIVAAEADIKERDEKYALLVQKLSEQQVADDENVAALEDAERQIKKLRDQLHAATADISATQAIIEERDAKYLSLEQRLAERDIADTERVAELEAADQQLAELRAELESAAREEHNLNMEVNRRDELYAVLEEKHEKLVETLSEQQKIDAENIAALLEARNEIELLTSELEAVRSQSAAEVVQAQQVTSTQVQELCSQVERTEAYADTLRFKVEELGDSLAEITRHRDDLQQELREQHVSEKALSETVAAQKEANNELLASLEQFRADHERELRELRLQLSEAQESMAAVEDRNSRLENDVADARSAGEAMEQKLGESEEQAQQHASEVEKLKADHEQELRTLRFELDEAQNTLSQTGDLNTQLAADLVDARGFKEELERMLTANEEQAQQRITDLEKQVENLSGVAEEFEQKLDTKNTAINVLLGELSKKSEQIDSIGEIEEVIHEIDSRMSERFDEPTEDNAKKAATPAGSGERDRTTRVLVGSVGDQELRFPLFKNRLTIGRTAENDIQLKTAYISRRHAVILTEGDSARIIDWGSKNGVYVNSQRVKEQLLSNGDIISVGNAKFRYEERPKRDS